MCLSALAGYVDVIGFLELGGYFVSFMSGNSTRFAVAVAQGDFAHAWLIAAIIFSFVLGAASGTLVGHHAGRSQQAFQVLALVTATLVAAILCYENGYPLAALLLTAFAMGAENMIFQREGEIAIALTYMTGTLVKLGQRIAQGLLGGSRTAWMPHLAMWLGLVGGGVSGALCYQQAGLHSLWVAALMAACLTLAVRMHPLR